MSAPVSTNGGTRRRLEHVDAMRPVKQFAVIGTHAMQFFAPAATTVLWKSGLIFTRFSRDAFLFVSACMLAYSYRTAARVVLRSYVWRRFMSVGAPYLAWTVIYWLWTACHPIHGFPLYALHSNELTWSALVGFTRWGYFHLYFLLILMQFYVVFPALLWVIRRFPGLRVHLLWSSLLIQILIDFANRGRWWGFHMSFIVETRVLISYPFYLVAGVVVALNFEEFHAWVVRRARPIVLLTLVAFAGASATNLFHGSHLYRTYLLIGKNPFGALAIPYDIGGVLCVYLLGVYLVDSRRHWRTRRLVAVGSDNAYGIYLSQMIFIPIAFRFVEPTHGRHLFPSGIACVIVILLTYAAGFILTGVIARTPLAKVVAGRSRATWRSLFPRSTPESAHGQLGNGPFDNASA